MKKIVLDAMGGDFAPANEVAGALLALQEHPGAFEVILVGDEARLGNELKKRAAGSLPLSVVHAAEVITMHDPPTAAVKAKKNSSIAVGMTMHKEGKADAFASAGNTRCDALRLHVDLGTDQGRQPADHRGVLPFVEGGMHPS